MNSPAGKPSKSETTWVADVFWPPPWKWPISPYCPWGVEGNEKVESKPSCCSHYEFPELGDSHGFPFHDLGICHEVPMPLTRITLTCRLGSWTRLSLGSPAVGCSMTLLPTEERKSCGRSRRSTLPLEVALGRGGGTWGGLTHLSPWLHATRRLPAHHHHPQMAERKMETLASPHKATCTACPPRAGQ